MERTIRLEAKVLGKKRGLGARELKLDDIDARPTLRALIASVVAAEVAAFEQRQEERGFIRLLTEGEMAQSASTGKIDSGQSTEAPAEIELKTAVETALLAFSDGLYIVMVDDEEILDLDAPVNLSEESTLLFLRLVAFSGGI